MPKHYPNDQEIYKRFSAYIKDEDLRKLKSILSLQGMSIAAWFRTTVQGFITKHE